MHWSGAGPLQPKQVSSHASHVLLAVVYAPTPQLRPHVPSGRRKGYASRQAVQSDAVGPPQ